MKHNCPYGLCSMPETPIAWRCKGLKTKGKEGVDASAGKTLKSAVDSFLSTFTTLQQDNIKERIRYKDLLATFNYRRYDRTKLAY